MFQNKNIRHKKVCYFITYNTCQSISDFIFGYNHQIRFHAKRNYKEALDYAAQLTECIFFIFLCIFIRISLNC